MSRPTRRGFLQSASAALAFSIVPAHVLGGPGKKAPSEKLNIAGIGVGGQGAGDLKDMARENIVALCDCDWKKAANTFKTYPSAQQFKDYRIMLDKIAKEIDAVMIATPDHMHAPIAMAAMRAGKHVYVEKPMAHTIEECRVMTAFAKKAGVVTQMGNNGHAGDGIRQTREWILAGAIGTVKEIHCWSDRPGKFWKQDLETPTDTPPVPEGLDWDLFLGCAPQRAYHPLYHPRAWRGWFDYGTGALGDMAVHNMDPAFYAMDLDAPIAAEARTSTPMKQDSFPSWQIITYEFAAKGPRPAVKMIWYDGGKMPDTPKDVEGEYKLADNGIMFVGDKGVMVCGGWGGAPRLFPGSRRKDFQQPEKSIPRSIGHRAEWIQACKDCKPEDAKAGFDYSGPFTEALLVGNLAVRLGRRIEWDSANMKVVGVPDAERLVRKSYRKGFAL